MAVMLAMAVLVGLGEKMAERFLPLYLIALGGGAFSVGLLNGLNTLLNALYSFPGGYASERFGYKRALLLFNLISIAGYSVVIAIPHWTAVVAGSVLFMCWSAVSLPATMDLVAAVLPSNKRTMGVSMHSLVRRIPMSLGPLLGGALIGVYGIEEGIRLAFSAAIVLAGVSLVMQQRMIEPEMLSSPAAVRSFGWSLLTAPLRRLLISDILVRFCEQIPYAFVVVWCVSVHSVTPFQFGILTTIEMVTSMLVYIPVAYFADRTVKKPFVLVTFAFFTVFPLALMASQTFWAMAAAFVVRGLKEFGEPTRKALIMDLAPEGRKAATFGFYYMVRDIVVSIAAFGGALLWEASPAANFTAAFAFGLAGTAYFAFFGRDPGTAPEVQKITKPPL